MLQDSLVMPDPGRAVERIVNDHARLSVNVLEDEKILGTVHGAFGASAGIGGNMSVPIHLDAVILEPTLDVGAERVLDAGRFVLDPRQ